MNGNNVHIRIPINYSGSGATRSVTTKFDRAIEKAWTGTFGGYKVTTEVVRGKHGENGNYINVPAGDGKATVSGTNRGTWPADRPGEVAAHEAGHLMALEDDRFPIPGTEGIMYDEKLPPTGTNIRKVIAGCPAP